MLERILELLGQRQPLSAVDIAGSENTSLATLAAPFDQHPIAESSNSCATVEVVHKPIPTSCPNIPGTPLNNASESENQEPLHSEDHGTEGDLGQDSEQQVGSLSEQTTKAVTESTPQQDWTRRQRERVRQEKEERERIKAQIKYDHAERRRVHDSRNQAAIDLPSSDTNCRTGSSFRSSEFSEVRVQIRTFEGSTFRSTFPRTALVSTQLRPWIDSVVQESRPYNLKIVQTPFPNRTIEAAEEDKSLEDLDIVGSCTLIMVQVKGFVESYAPPGSGIIGSAVSGSYNLLSGSFRTILNGAQSVLGFVQASAAAETPSTSGEAPSRPTGQVRIRTLADQRMEEKKKDQQFYNGNQLNFEPRKDNEDGKND